MVLALVTIYYAMSEITIAMPLAVELRKYIKDEKVCDESAHPYDDDWEKRCNTVRTSFAGDLFITVCCKGGFKITISVVV